tara:strand:- start:12546 stop:13115 length:570 start_codon:yes stop_codon:yes gene_type:complete
MDKKSNSDSFSDFIALGSATTHEALALFDSLNGVNIDFMLGNWKGASFPTGHSLDGVLEVYHWYGKTFESAEHVHPLVFTHRRGSKVNVNPALIPLCALDVMPILKAPFLGRLMQYFIPLLTTQRSRARLRMTSYRGKVSATMIYDHKPINDVFRQVDSNTVLGIMDRKGMEQPFFFVLQNERSWHYSE